MKPEEMVGRRIAEIRERLGMTQQQLGEQLEPLLGRPWPRQTVSAAEKGSRAFTATELLAIAQVLDAPIHRLLAPPIDLEQVEMPGGSVLSRADVENVSDAATANLLHYAARVVRDMATRLTERIDSDREELKKLIDEYEHLTKITVPDAEDARGAQP